MNKFFKNLPSKKAFLRRFPHLSIKRRSTILILVIGFIFLFLASLLKLLLSSENIKVQTDSISCVSRSDLELLANADKINFFLKEDVLKNKLKKKYNCIEDIQRQFQFPLEINLQVSGRKPVAIITQVKKVFDSPILPMLEATSSSIEAVSKPNPSNNIFIGDSFLVDSEGFLFAQSQNRPDLTQIKFVTKADNNLAIGQQILKDSLKKVLEIKFELLAKGIQFDSIELEDSKVTFGGKEHFIFSLDSDYIYQVASLQLILQKAKMNSKSVEKVDLRFNKPIVVYTPDKKR